MSKRTVRSPLEVLYSKPHDSADETIEIDIIAVHGLGSNVDWSWIWKDGAKHIHWLKDPDMLPAAVPHSRIITYSYESRWHTDAPRTRLELCGEELARVLHDFRAEVQDRPVLFIAHSLGGLVVIYALLYANRMDELRYLPQNTAGFIALGTPFRGTGMQSLAETVTRFLTPLGSHNGILTDINLNNKNLTDKVHEFCELRNKLDIPSWCFFELLESDYGRKVSIPWIFKGIVVEEASAHIPGWGRTGLNTDHFYLNKFSGPDDGSYMAVSREIRQMYNRVYSRLGPPRKRQKQNESAQELPQQVSNDSGERLKELLNALYFGQINSRRHNVSLPSQNTCTWVLETAQYQDWVKPSEDSTHDDILWIKGKPGVGKSTIMNFLYEESTSTMPELKKFSFFFNARGNQLEKTTLGLYRALLWDILRTSPHLIGVFDDVIIDSIKTDGWRDQHIQTLLERAIKKLSSDEPLVCYIDALDECPEDQIRLMAEHFRKISKRTAQAGNCFKICFSSRHYPNISIANALSLTLEEHR